MAPVAGIPPKRAEPMLPAPCAISSMLDLWWELIIESATTQDKSDSIAARIAMVKPSPATELIISKSKAGTFKEGSVPLISYRSPIVLTLSPMSLTISIPTITATKEPGIFLLILGHTIWIRRHTTPTTRAHTLIVPMLSPIAFTFSMVSTVLVPAGYVRPRKSFICPTRIVTAIPAVNPVVMV